MTFFSVDCISGCVVAKNSLIACLDSIGGKVNDLELRVIAMEERQERQELILSDHLIHRR